MISVILKILGAGLSIWDNELKTKYQDEYKELKTRIYEEENKLENERDDAVLDNLYFRLRVLCDSFAANISEKNSAPKP